MSFKALVAKDAITARIIEQRMRRLIHLHETLAYWRVRIATNRSFQLSPFLPSSYVLPVVHTTSAQTFIWTLVFVIFTSWIVQVIHRQSYLIHPCWQLLCCHDSKEWEEANKALRDEKDRLNKHYLDLKRTLDRLYTSEHQKLKVASTLQHAEVCSRLTLQLTLPMSA